VVCLPYGHAPGAINVPHTEVDALTPSLLPDKHAAIVTYCSNTQCQNSEVAARRLIAWPKDGSGWTIVLASVPVGAGNRAVAIRQARDAVDQGLRHVGILTSSGYSSLHPGYLVVFSGVYANRSAAEQALSRARAAGYNAGYTREIVP